MERLRQRLKEARKALESLDQLVRSPEPPSAVARDAAIIRFTYTFEAVWKCARQYLADMEGIEAASPKAAVRASRTVNLLADADATTALSMADDRNLIVHTYKEALAEEIFGRLKGHAAVLEGWLGAMEKATA